MSTITTTAALTALLALAVGCGGGDDSDIDTRLAALKPDTYETMGAVTACDALAEHHDFAIRNAPKVLAELRTSGGNLARLIVALIPTHLATANATEVRMAELGCDSSSSVAADLKREACDALDDERERFANAFNEEVVVAIREMRDALGC